MAFQLPTTTSSTTSNFSFGLNAAAATANPGAANTAAAVPAKPAFSFGAPTSTGNAADSTKAAPPPFSGLVGLAGSSTAAPTSSAATAPTTAAAPTLGGFMSQPTPPAATTASASATTANPLGGISFGLTATAPKTTSATTAATAPTLGTGASLSTATEPAAGGGGTFANLSTATKTTDSSTVANATQLSYNQLQEHINKWTLEFEEQEKVFVEQALQINAWDKMLINNNEKIIELNDAVHKVKMDQQMLDQELEFIATQHKELEESLVPLEKEFTSLPRVDPDRSQTYLMVENLDTQLKQMSEDLKEIIDNLNEANKAQDQTDPIIQIGRILNAHMNSLQWIETQSTHICKKLDEIAKIQENHKRDIFQAPF